MLPLLLLLVLCALCALPWGPGTHLEFEHRVFRRRRERLPASVADLIEAERRAYQYGNIAADIINLKSIGGHYNHCHRWTIVRDMQAGAVSDAEHARGFLVGMESPPSQQGVPHWS